MPKEKRYQVFFLEEVKMNLLTGSVTIKASPIRTLIGVTEHSKTYSTIEGSTEDEVRQKLEKQRKDDNLFLNDLRKTPENSDFIIIPKMVYVLKEKSK